MKRIIILVLWNLKFKFWEIAGYIRNELKRDVVKGIKGAFKGFKGVSFVKNEGLKKDYSVGVTTVCWIINEANMLMHMVNFIDETKDRIVVLGHLVILIQKKMLVYVVLII
jgi:hypothetical protein